MEKPSDASRIIDGQWAPFVKWLIGVLCCLCKGCIEECKPGFFFSYARAPEPSDIYWQNLGIPSYERFFRGGASLIGTSGIMAVSIFVINILKKYQLEKTDEAAELKKT